MVDFIKYFFRIKKINFLLTFLSLLNFGIMFGAEEKKEEHKIKIKFEKKDEVEKEPFAMFLENFCQILGLNIGNIDKEDFRKSKYDFKFYYKDSDEDHTMVYENKDFDIFYINGNLYEEESKIGYLFLEKDEKEGNNIIKAYDEIINKEEFKNILITVYIKEKKKKKKEEKKEENNVNYKYMENDLDGNVDKKNNDCPCCNWCNCC